MKSYKIEILINQTNFVKFNNNFIDILLIKKTDFNYKIHRF